MNFIIIISLIVGIVGIFLIIWRIITLHFYNKALKEVISDLYKDIKKYIDDEISNQQQMRECLQVMISDVIQRLKKLEEQDKDKDGK